MTAVSKKKAAVLIIFAATVSVWAVTLLNGFVYDDNKILLGNPWVTDIGRIPDVFRSSMMAFDPAAPPANTYRPMLIVAFMAEYALFGFNPFWFHLVNVLVHAFNAVLVFMIACALLDSGEGGHRWADVLPPFFAGLIFGLHTVNSEAVNWVSASAELLYSFFCLAGFYLYMRGRSAAKGAVAALFLLMALLFKEPGAALLGLVVLFDVSTKGKKAFSCWKGYAFMAAAAGLYAALRVNAVGGLMHHKQIGFSTAEAIINIFPLLTDYVSKLFWPAGLNALYMFRAAHSVFEPKVLTGALFIAVMLASLLLARRQKALFMGLCFMLLPLLPVLYVPALSTSAFADRYLYLPSAGFSMIAAFFFKRIAGAYPYGRMTGVISAAALIALGALAAASVERSMAWRNDLSLWADTAAKSPLSSNAHYNYAWAAHRDGNTRIASEQYAEAARLDPKGSADAHYNLGLIYLDAYMLDEAEREFRAALASDPAYRGAAEMISRVERLKAGAQGQ